MLRLATVACSLSALALIACSGSEGRDHNSDTAELAGVRQQLDTLFQTIDTDLDGAISYQEILQSNLTYNNPRTGESFQGEASAQAWIDTFDLNRDGVIAHAEMLTGVEQMLESQS